MNAHLHHPSTSPTAVICENLERFGGAPARGEPDPRAVWDESEALAGLETILDAFIEEVAPDGTQLADERESLLWGFVNTLHMQMTRLDRAVDRLSPKLKELQHAQDGTEINAWELERVIERCRHLGDRRDAFERMRDCAAQRYRSDTGNTWRPRNGFPHVPHLETHLRGDRRPGLHARAPRAEEHRAPAGRDARGGRRFEADQRRRRDLCSARQRARQVRRHGAGARRRPGR